MAGILIKRSMHHIKCVENNCNIRALSTHLNRALIPKASFSRPYHISVRDAKSLKHKCSHEDSKGHAVGIERLCKK